MATRSNVIVPIKDEDRNLDLTLSVDFDWLPEGAVEHPTVEVIRGVMWFGKYGADLVPGNNAKQIAREIETRYAAEIVEAVVDEHQRQIEAARERQE